jgi:predicted transcriptional regulator
MSQGRLAREKAKAVIRQLAQDRKPHTFTEFVTYAKTRSGISRATISKYLKELVQENVLTIELTPDTYKRVYRLTRKGHQVVFTSELTSSATSKLTSSVTRLFEENTGGIDISDETKERLSSALIGNIENTFNKARSGLFEQLPDQNLVGLNHDSKKTTQAIIKLLLEHRHEAAADLVKQWSEQQTTSNVK